jgi:hypothetical protein
VNSRRKTFVEVGLALATIRDDRLYRADFGTFEEYCQTKWNIGRRYANLLIESSAVVKALPLGTIVPTESQARELAKVEPARRVEVLEKAAESGKVTARTIVRLLDLLNRKIILAMSTQIAAAMKSFFVNFVGFLVIHRASFKLIVTLISLEFVKAGRSDWVSMRLWMLRITGCCVILAVDTHGPLSWPSIKESFFPGDFFGGLVSTRSVCLKTKILNVPLVDFL